MHPLAKLDRAFVWHPFTQMRDWLRQEPRVISSGQGAVLWDVRGREYLDANSSIWTNLHGHNHPQLNAALGRQLRKIAHSAALGLANEPASRLAAQLVQAANANYELRITNDELQWRGARKSHIATPKLRKVFFSDDGSTALEVALKLAYEFTRRTRGISMWRAARPRFLSLAGAYHGDTVGAVSLGHIDLFHKSLFRFAVQNRPVMAPYCYRCPSTAPSPNAPTRANYRQCHWECVGQVEQEILRRRRKGNAYAAFVFEPLMQGAAGMIPQPAGWLQARHRNRPQPRRAADRR